MCDKFVCRICKEKNFDDFLELNKHELQCWNKKEWKRKEEEKAEIEKRNKEEKVRLQNEMANYGIKLSELRNAYVCSSNDFKKMFQHVEGFEKWESMLINDDEINKNTNTNKVIKFDIEVGSADEMLQLLMAKHRLNREDYD